MRNNKIRFFHTKITLIKTVILTILLSLLKFSLVFPQNDFQNVLSNAEKLYEGGHFAEVIDLLTSYVTEDISRAEKIESYRLLAHAYFGLNQPDKAEEAIIYLLFWNYDYMPNPNKDRQIFIDTLNDLRSKLPRPPKIPQVLLEPIDFGCTKKGKKWSHEFSKHLKNFFANCDSIKLILIEDYQYQKVYPLNYFLLSGNGKKENKSFVLDISLTELYKLNEVWCDTVSATDQRGLADSAGVQVARYFGYKTNFIRMKIPIKPFAVASGVSALASFILNNQVQIEKGHYRDALTSKDAKSSFNKLRTYEMSRNSFGSLSGILLTPIVYTILNPRRPTFEKIIRK